MKKLLKPFKSKAMLQIALFAALFGVMDVFIEMKKKTEEQTTYSVTLEDLLHAQNETDGENGGGGADGEAGGGGSDGEAGGQPGGEGTNGTPQAGKHTRNVTKTITKYFKWEAGVKVFVSASTQGAQETKVTITWSCCCPGGNSCSSNNPDCGSNYCED